MTEHRERSEEHGDYQVGETILLAVVPEAEALVGPWRQRFDPSAAAGVPAHVTVLGPFLDIDLLDAPTLDELGTLIGGHRAFDVRFEHCGRFPGVLYLAPEPAQPFRELTEALAARWPQCPPYRGEFPEITPHLTAAHTRQPEVLDEATAMLAGQLPVTARVSSVQLFVSDGYRWDRRTTFPLLG